MMGFQEKMRRLKAKLQRPTRERLTRAELRMGKDRINKRYWK